MVVNTHIFKIQTESIREFQAEDTGLNNTTTELKTALEEFNSRQMKQENSELTNKVMQITQSTNNKKRKFEK